MRNWKIIFTLGGILVLLALLPFFTTRSDVLTLSCLTLQYILLSQSWNIIGGYAGQVNLGHAAFFGLGALATRYVWLSGLPFPIALLSGGLVAMGFALLIGTPAFRLKGFYFVIGTLVLAEILRGVIDTYFPVASVLPAETLLTYSLIPRYYLSLMGAILGTVSVYFIGHSRLGLGMIAIREDEDAAKASGVGILRYKLIAFVISTFLAGFGGGIFAFYMVAIQPGYVFSPIWTFDPVVIVYVGGIGTVIGPIIGSVFFVLLKQWLSLHLPGGLHLAVFGVLFIIVVLYMPDGLIEAIRRYGKMMTSGGKPAVQGG